MPMQCIQLQPNDWLICYLCSIMKCKRDSRTRACRTWRWDKHVVCAIWTLFSNCHTRNTLLTRLGNICSSKNTLTFMPTVLLSSQHICLYICCVNCSRKMGTLLLMKASALRTLYGPAPLLPLVNRKLLLLTHCLRSVHLSIKTHSQAHIFLQGSKL